METIGIGSYPSQVDSGWVLADMQTLNCELNAVDIDVSDAAKSSRTQVTVQGFN